jgi:class 3 adenylate cyclase
MVAVLFTDLVGSTDLMARLGEAAYDDLRRPHFAALAQAIERTGGEEIKNTGDGVMATFGSVVDAIGCAVAMQQATERQARTAEAPLAIRVGLSVGEVTFEADDVFGVPVVEAARLVAAAAGGQIVTTVIAKALAAGRAEADFVDLGLLELKGLPQAVAACEVLWEPLPQPTLPLPGLVSDVGRIFVGRDAELERLRQLWKEAVAGEGRLALLTGEPGVGKTRLAAELAAQVQVEGATVLAGRCDEDLGVPYQPFVEALRHFVDHTAELEERLGRYGGELTRLVPELSDRVPGLPPPLTSEPETERYRLFDAVAAWLATVSAEQPLLLVLDDLQWGAKPTLLLLRHIVCSADLKRIMVVGTYRDTELGHGHPLFEVVADLRRRGGVERLSLTGLDPSGVAAFMEQAAEHALDDEDLLVARAVHEETEGNPFFVREVFRHLIETGAVERRDGRWGTRLPVEEIGIPESVRDVVGRRLSRLSEEANQALRMGAVVGAEFDASVVQAVAGLDEETLLCSLEEAAHARLIIEAPGARYRFAHALVRDTLYGELSGPRRLTLHRKVAEAIEALHVTRLDDFLPALAHHWAQASAPAGDTAKAIDYATRAGHRALAQLAHDEAVVYFTRALELYDAARSATGESGRLDLLLALGEAQRRAGQAAFRATLLDATNIARRLGDTERLVRAVLANSRGVHSDSGVVDWERVEALEAAAAALGEDEHAARARVLATLASELVFAGDWHRRRKLSDEAVAAARRAGDDATLARVLNMRGFVVQVPETLEQRLAETSEGLEVSARLGDPFERYYAMWLRRQAAAEAGDFREADWALDQQERLASALGQPPLRWYVMMQRVWGEALAGRLDRAERLATEAFQLGQEIEHPDASVLYAMQLFMIRLDQGRLDELEPTLTEAVAATPGLPILRAALAMACSETGRREEARRLFAVDAGNGFSGVPYDLLWGGSLAVYASVCRDLGDVQAAAVLYEKLASSSGLLAFAVIVTLGATDHHLGELATTLSRFDHAETHFAAAEVFHERIGAPSWLARGRLEWARMLLARRQAGDVERARRLLSQAVATAQEFGLGNVERQAVALLQ